MANQITNYKCPACTGPLHFDGASGKVVCDYCGSSYSVEEIEKLYGAGDEAAKEEAKKAAEKEEAEKKDRENNPELWEYVGDSWGKDAAGMKTYSCPSCSAELICDETTGATSCPYCGNPTMVPGTFDGKARPDLILPFKLKKEQAIAALKKHYENKPLLPPEFVAENHIQEIKGVYVPFWLFNGTANIDAVYEGKIVNSYTTGDEEVTETDTYHLHRSGRVEFQRIPVNSSSKMPNTHMDAIEPFDYSDLKPFSTPYLTGFLADKYDISLEDCSAHADERSESSALGTLASSISGYSGVDCLQKNVHLERGKVEYALLPVWLLSTKWNGGNYLFAMNGQTGKLIGDLPVSDALAKAKWRKTFAVSTVVLSAIFLALGFFFL